MSITSIEPLDYQENKLNFLNELHSALGRAYSIISNNHFQINYFHVNFIASLKIGFKQLVCLNYVLK